MPPSTKQVLDLPEKQLLIKSQDTIFYTKIISYLLFSLGVGFLGNTLTTMLSIVHFMVWIFLIIWAKTTDKPGDGGTNMLVLIFFFAISILINLIILIYGVIIRLSKYPTQYPHGLFQITRL